MSLLPDTKILLSDGTEKAIVELNEGDELMVYDFELQKFKFCRITELKETKTDTLTQLVFTDDENFLYPHDQPFYSEKEGWCSMNPYQSSKKYGVDAIKFKIGFILLGFTKDEEIKEIGLKVYFDRTTYEIVSLDSDGKYFVANGLLTCCEK